MAEKKCLVTTSLIGSVEWVLAAPETVIKVDRGGDGKTTWSEKAKKDLLAMLSREKTEFPKEAEQGVKFEAAVYANANLEKIPSHFSNEFKTICEEVKGYTFFGKQGKDVKIGKENVYLYAKYDAIRLPRIIDLKTTKEYKFGKYLKGVQHEIYCYVSGAQYFDYLIAEWEDYPKIKQIHKESYVVKDEKVQEDKLFSKIEECFSCIKDLGLWEVYRSKYCLY